MNILAIDTSSKYICLAIAEDDKILAKFHKPLGAKLSRLIMPVIDRALKKSGLSIKRIDYFTVGLGPGSFTGLRVGLATIKGLAFSLNKPITGVASLDTIARSAHKFTGCICPVVDAKRSLVYSAIYKLKNGQLRRRSRYMLISVKELLKKFKRKDKIFFLGDGLLLYRNEIAGKLGGSANFADENSWYPKPENLIAIAREGMELDNPDKIVPLYLYPKECQISQIANR